jgi:hypothetical protein
MSPSREELHPAPVLSCIGRIVPARSKYKNNIFPSQKCLACRKAGSAAVRFLVEGFTFLGFDVQNWMLVVVGLIAAFIFFVWKTRDRV